MRYTRPQYPIATTLTVIQSTPCPISQDKRAELQQEGCIDFNVEATLEEPEELMAT